MNHTEYNWINSLRVFATLCVILLHTSSYLLPQYGKISINLWLLGNFYDGSVRFCVPIFFMISGALLLSKDYTLIQFLKKRFYRLIPPCLFWSFIYSIFRVSLNIYNGINLNLCEIFKLIFKNIYFGSEFHLWFVYTLIGLYLFIPIINQWAKNANSK